MGAEFPCRHAFLHRIDEHGDVRCGECHRLVYELKQGPSPFAWGGPVGGVGDCSGWLATYGERGPVADDERSAPFVRAQEAISRVVEHRMVAEAEAREKALRDRLGAAIAAGLKDQARQHPGFHCDTTAEKDMFVVSGILTVSELVESIVKALSDG